MPFADAPSAVPVLFLLQMASFLFHSQLFSAFVLQGCLTCLPGWEPQRAGCSAGTAVAPKDKPCCLPRLLSSQPVHESSPNLLLSFPNPGVGGLHQETVRRILHRQRVGEPRLKLKFAKLEWQWSHLPTALQGTGDAGDTARSLSREGQPKAKSPFPLPTAPQSSWKADLEI